MWEVYHFQIFIIFIFSKKLLLCLANVKNNDYGTEKIYCFLRLITPGTGT